MLNNIVKMEQVEEFVKEANLARNGLSVIRPGIMTNVIEQIRMDEEFFFNIFIPYAVDYIIAACPSCEAIAVSENLLKDALTNIVKDVCMNAPEYYIIGVDIVNDIAAKIVWQMLND